MPVRSDSRSTDRLVFLHGFTQTHHHWHAVAHTIAQALDRSPVLTFVDLPGHGLAAADRTPIADAGDPLATLAGRGTYVGYSMGGRFALVAAVARPDLVERRVQELLSKLNIPTAGELERLRTKLAEVNAELEALRGSRSATQDA